MGKILTGLISVTFRQLQALEIIQLAKQAGLDGIEWAGDVHVPHGDLDQAQRVAQLTRDAGLSLTGYGSYYRVGHSESVGLSFQSVLETALALGVPSVRVWAGNLSSAQADFSYRNWVVEECRRIARLAQDQELTVVAEYHDGTLMDTAASAVALLEEVNHPHFKSLWQQADPYIGDTNFNNLVAISPWLTNIHVNNLDPVTRQQHPLSEAMDQWKKYLRHSIGLAGERYALLEFVDRDSPEAFLCSANTLKEWLKELHSESG